MGKKKLKVGVEKVVKRCKKQKTETGWGRRKRKGCGKNREECKKDKKKGILGKKKEKEFLKKIVKKCKKEKKRGRLGEK